MQHVVKRLWNHSDVFFLTDRQNKSKKIVQEIPISSPEVFLNLKIWSTTAAYLNKKTWRQSAVQYFFFSKKLPGGKQKVFPELHGSQREGGACEVPVMIELF